MRNPFNGIESLRTFASRGIGVVVNPFNGIESKIAGKHARSGNRIHSMELKVSLSYCAQIVLAMRMESIQWN